MTQLLCEDLVLGYEGQAVVSGLSFQVNQGDYLFILGENGSGKSTLIKTLLRLIPPLSGKVELGGGLLAGCLNRMGRRPFYSRAEKAEAQANLERLGIVGLARRCYRELSGGQQQRVLLARALCAAQRVLLLDEPTSGLDPSAAREMYELIARLNREGLTVITVSHDLPAAARYASHVLHLAHRPLFFGPREAYLQSEVGRACLAMAKGEEDA